MAELAMLLGVARPPAAVAVRRVRAAGVEPARSAARRGSLAASPHAAAAEGAGAAAGAPAGLGLAAWLCAAAGGRRCHAKAKGCRYAAGSGRASADGRRRLLVVDPCTAGLLQRLTDAGCEVFQRQPPETVSQALVRARPEVVVIRSSLLMEEQLLGDGAEQLGLVMRAGAGVDNLAVQALTQRGVIVANAAGANAVAVAELTMAHLLNADRRLSDQVESLRRGEWRRLEFAEGALGLYGRTLAVLGVGYIGREVVLRARAFGMVVRCWSRSLSPAAAEELGAIWCGSPEEAVEGAHALTVHLPLVEATKGLVSEELLRRLCLGGIVVNMSRGGIVDEAALLRLCAERGLRAGLDVFAEEPGAAGREFRGEAIRTCGAVYGTHHTGARTEQAAISVEDAVARAVAAYLRGEPVPGEVR